MQNDWRTDNWAGHYPIQNDPRCYRFARHLREFDHGASYNFGQDYGDDDIQPWKVVITVLIILTVIANLNYLINFLTHINDYYTIWLNCATDMIEDIR